MSWDQKWKTLPPFRCPDGCSMRGYCRQSLELQGAQPTCHCHRGFLVSASGGGIQQEAAALQQRLQMHLLERCRHMPAQLAGPGSNPCASRRATTAPRRRTGATCSAAVRVLPRVQCCSQLLAAAYRSRGSAAAQWLPAAERCPRAACPLCRPRQVPGRVLPLRAALVQHRLHAQPRVPAQPLQPQPHHAQNLHARLGGRAGGRERCACAPAVGSREPAWGGGAWPARRQAPPRRPGLTTAAAAVHACRYELNTRLAFDQEYWAGWGGWHDPIYTAYQHFLTQFLTSAVRTEGGGA